MISLTNFNDNSKTRIAYTLPPAYSVSFTYEGGRLYVYVDNKLIFETMSAGDDFSIELNKHEE